MKRKAPKKWLFFFPAFFALAIPLWLTEIVPRLLALPKNYHYEAQILSLDNFYDEETEQFTGEKRSVTQFYYDVVGEENGNLLVKNLFDVRTVTGEKVFSVERVYGIDPVTGKHAPGLGDRDREGHLFAPRHLKKGDPFTYWHINYDGPANMTYAGEENLFGLNVYRYVTNYEGVRIDQTDSLGFLPGVPTERGVELEPQLQIWVEPTTGNIVKYRDRTVAYYYDRASGARLNPWNSFSNTLTRASVMHRVGLANMEKQKADVIEIFIPLLLALLAIVSLVFLLGYRTLSFLVALLGFLGLAGYMARPLVSAAPSEHVTIGISTWAPLQNKEYTRNIQGFKDALTEAGFIEGKNITYDIQTAAFDEDKQRNIAKMFQEEHADLIYSLTTHGTRSLKNEIRDLPIVFSIVTFPVENGLIESLQASGNNLVGTRNYVPVVEQLSNFLKLKPDTKSIAFIHRQGEINSGVQLDRMRSAASERGIKVIEVAATDMDSLKAKLAELKELDVVYSACDTLVQSQAEEVIADFISRNRLASFSCNASGPEHQDLLATVADYYQIGKLAGQKAALILEGATPTSLETNTVDRSSIIYNETRAAELNLHAPLDLLVAAKRIIQSP